MDELEALIDLLRQKGFTVNFDHDQGSNIMQCRITTKTVNMNGKSYLVSPMISTIISPINEKDAAIKMHKLVVHKLRINGYINDAK